MEVLTDETFDSTTKDGFWLVEFYAPVSKPSLAAASHRIVTARRYCLFIRSDLNV